VHGQQVAVQDARAAHAHALDAQQVMRFPREQPGVHAVLVLDVLLGQQRAARGHAADQRQRLVRGAGQLGPGHRQQGDAARQAPLDTDDGLFLQSPQVRFRRVGRAEAEVRGQF
jgi:hypothetical protein